MFGGNAVRNAMMVFHTYNKEPFRQRVRAFLQAADKPTVSLVKNTLVYFISIVYIDHPVWRGHRDAAKSGPPCGSSTWII
jgi:hypothetical protein